MIPRLNVKYIEGAKLTAFRAENIDNIIKGYKDVAASIEKHIEKGKEEKLSKLCDLYDNYLYALGNHVGAAVAGRSKYKSQSTGPIDKALRKIIDYVEVIEEELKQIDYEKNKEKYDKQKEMQKKISLINEIGYYQDINKTLFYQKLVELHDLDEDTFKKVYDAVKDKMANNSKAAKLYKKLVENIE